MKSVCLVGLMLVFSCVQAVARDPACQTAKGKAVLQTLRSCDRLYCSQPKEPAIPSAIKVMDDTLTQHEKAFLEMDKMVSSFKRVCAKLTKTFCEDCSDFREFQILHMKIDQKTLELNKLEDGMKNFVPSLNTINTVEGDLACHKHISDLIDRAAPATRELRAQFNQIKCRP